MQNQFLGTVQLQLKMEVSLCIINKCTFWNQGKSESQRTHPLDEDFKAPKCLLTAYLL